MSVSAMNLSPVPAAKPGIKGRGAAGGAIALIIAAILAVEGGYVNNPADPGGETNLGVTKQVAREEGYSGPMRELTRAQAAAIYERRYIDVPGWRPLVEIDPALAEEAIDTTVNMGPGRPARWFQQSVNQVCGARITVDGRIGPRTLGAYARCRVTLGPVSACVAMLDAMDARQRAEYNRLVRVNPRLGTFHRGWIRHRIGNVSRAKCGSAAA